MENIKKLEKIATQVRRDIIRMVNAAKSGHPGGSMGCADFLTALYFNILKHDPQNFSMEGKNEDIFILSNGHISPAFYSVLARSGYFDVSELATFRMLGTRLQGHPSSIDGLPGVRIASGSLGQGLSVACGIALAKKINNDKNFIYALLGDGELQEGQIWEAAMFASANKIDNLIATVDYNKLQIDGSIEEVLSLGNLRSKWESFDWTVIEMNGNDMKCVIEGINQAISLTGKGKPVCIIMHTKMGFGVDFMLDNNKWHGSPTNNEETRIALGQLEETIGDY